MISADLQFKSLRNGFYEGIFSSKALMDNTLTKHRRLERKFYLEW